MDQMPLPPDSPTTVPDTSSIVGGLFTVLARRWWWIPLGSLLGTLCAILIMRVADPRYEAVMLLAPANDSASALAGKLGQFSGLASLAGVRLPDSESATPFSQFTELLTSREVIEDVDRQLNLQRLFFPDHWNPETNRLEARAGLSSAVKTMIADISGTEARLAPNLDDVRRILEEKLSVTVVPKTGIREVSFEFRDRETAVAILKALHETADRMVRERAQVRTRQQIDVLLEKLPSVTYPEQREGIANLLIVQEQQAMVAAAGENYAANIVSDATASTRPVFPKPTVMLVSGILLGALLAVAAALGTTALGLRFSRPND